MNYIKSLAFMLSAYSLVFLVGWAAYEGMKYLEHRGLSTLQQFMVMAVISALIISIPMSRTWNK